MPPLTKKPRMEEDATNSRNVVEELLVTQTEKRESNSSHRYQNNEWDRILTKAPLAHVYGVTGIFTTPRDEVYVTHKKGGYRKLDSLSGKNIKAFISGSDSNCFALSENGVYSWGSDNKSGQLGLGAKVKNVTPFMACQIRGSLRKTTILDLAASEDHVLALTELVGEHQVHSWGNNTRGQLGLGDRRNRLHPQQVQYLGTTTKVVQIAVTQNMSYVLTEEGEVVSWGSPNPTDELSNANNPRMTGWFPGQVTTAKPVKFKKIESSKNKIIALSVCGTVYAFQGCGCGPAFPYDSDTFQNVVDIAGDARVEECAFQTTNGNIYSWDGIFGKISIPRLRQNVQAIHHIFRRYPRVDVGSQEMFTAPTDCSQAKRQKMKTVSDLQPAKSVDSREHKIIPDDLNDSTALFLVNGDIEFLVENKTIRAHRKTLMKLSGHFKKLLRDIEECFTTIEVVNTTFSGFSAFLHYLYLEKIVYSSQETENLFDLMQLAQRFDEVELVRKCHDMLSNSMTDANVFKIFRLSVSLNFEDLEKLALQFILENKIPFWLENVKRNFENDLNAYEKFTKGLLNLQLEARS